MSGTKAPVSPKLPVGTRRRLSKSPSMFRRKSPCQANLSRLGAFYTVRQHIVAKWEVSLPKDMSMYDL